MIKNRLSTRRYRYRGVETLDPITAIIRLPSPDSDEHVCPMPTCCLRIRPERKDVSVGGLLVDEIRGSIRAINPLKAIDPGLIYDLKADDYILFLCNNGYTKDQIKRIISLVPGTDVNCPKEFMSDTNLNYPSITVSSLESTVTIKRTVRNVGGKIRSMYFARIVSPHV
ncbi:hypothetical protein L2E82_40076 [Cichorium intybus]|uniref:Uncharacterized protein n=1 Tax=Cichorium intybus TaxID=13427 RepID=A0ACB9ALP5_CICIN|nr:hypothetical protein L2E82_40076 [Cichorium intybus]